MNGKEFLPNGVMDSAFLSGDAKAKHVERLMTLTPEEGPSVLLESPEPAAESSSSNAGLQIASALLGGVATTLIANNLGFDWEWANLAVSALIVVGLVAGIVIVSAIVFVLVSNLSKKEATSEAASSQD